MRGFFISAVIIAAAIAPAGPVEVLAPREHADAAAAPAPRREHADAAAAPAPRRKAPADTIIATPTGVVFGAGELREPLGLATDVRGFLFVADAMAGKVFRYAPDGTSLEFEAPPVGAGVYPIDVAAYGSYVYVLDYAGNQILRYDHKGAYLDVLISFASRPGRMRPTSLTTSAGGRLLTTDAENHAVAVWSPLLDVEINTGEYGWAGGSFNRPSKAAFFGAELIAVADFGNRRVQVLSGSGRFERFLAPGDEARFESPRYLCGGPEGHLFVADTGGGAVHVFSPAMNHLFSIGGDTAEVAPAAVAAGWDDMLYVADLHSGSVIVYRLSYPGK